ncbi:hypothetical protein NQ318_009583 [Aromia moschata]|uniref:Uncharacterized protein n=1 Tax=Aromia moschata TaxID=1265417 RepID=A0AAV8Y4L2_9CUCU|nr:hypothetical protein NQ318_009583 [Aromia moschata]
MTEDGAPPELPCQYDRASVCKGLSLLGGLPTFRSPCPDALPIGVFSVGVPPRKFFNTSLISGVNVCDGPLLLEGLMPFRSSCSEPLPIGIFVEFLPGRGVSYWYSPITGRNAIRPSGDIIRSQLRGSFPKKNLYLYTQEAVLYRNTYTTPKFIHLSKLKSYRKFVKMGIWATKKAFFILVSKTLLNI